MEMRQIITEITWGLFVLIAIVNFLHINQGIRILRGYIVELLNIRRNTEVVITAQSWKLMWANYSRGFESYFRRHMER